jgi:hypothetical protein
MIKNYLPISLSYGAFDDPILFFGGAPKLRKGSLYSGLRSRYGRCSVPPQRLNPPCSSPSASMFTCSYLCPLNTFAKIHKQKKAVSNKLLTAYIFTNLRYASAISVDVSPDFFFLRFSNISEILSTT